MHKDVAKHHHALMIIMMNIKMAKHHQKYSHHDQFLTTNIKSLNTELGKDTNISFNTSLKIKYMEILLPVFCFGNDTSHTHMHTSLYSQPTGQN